MLVGNMGLLKWFARRCAPIGGAVLWVVGAVLQAQGLSELGVGLWWWRIIGAAVFFGSVLYVMYTQEYTGSRNGQGSRDVNRVQGNDMIVRNVQDIHATDTGDVIVTGSGAEFPDLDD